MKILMKKPQNARPIEFQDLRSGVDDDRLAELEGQVYELKATLRVLSDRISRLEYRE